MMWIAFAAGWILGSASLYLCLMVTAREPENEECVECHLPECRECPYLSKPEHTAERQAA